MIIRMRYQMSGGRHDGRPWPWPDTDFDVPDCEGTDLIRGEMAVASGKDAEAVMAGLAEQPTPGHPSKVDARPAAEQENAGTAEPSGELPSLAPDVAGKDEAGGAGNAEDEAAESSPVAEAPGPSAPKQAWIDYAVQVQGADVHEASAMTKADLMSRYGGRL